MKTTKPASHIPLANARGSEALFLSRDREGAVGEHHTNRRGVALLSVLWLAAALSAIAFTVANLVRAETERALTGKDAVRAYYLASGAIEPAMLYVQWGPACRNPDGSPHD